MKKVYTVLAYVVAVEVMIQAMLIAWAIAGLGRWVASGGIFDQSVIDSQATPFPEVLGIPLHGMNGSFVIPIITLLLLITSFFTHLRGATKWAVVVVVLAIVQGQLGYLGHDIPALGAVHGLNALLLFVAAVVTARRTRTAPPTVRAEAEAQTASV